MSKDGAEGHYKGESMLTCEIEMQDGYEEAIALLKDENQRLKKAFVKALQGWGMLSKARAREELEEVLRGSYD